MAPATVLPSDSIIYADIGQAYALSRHQSRQQQTSFDYDADSGNYVHKRQDKTRVKLNPKIDRKHVLPGENSAPTEIYPSWPSA